MDIDDKLLTEAYEELQEGFLDRMKARAAGAKGAVKGFGQKVSGKAKGAMAGMRGDVEGVKAADQQVQSAASMGITPKAARIMSIHIDKLNKTIDDMNNDLEKLGLNDKSVAEIAPEVQKAVYTLKGAVNNLKSRLGAEKSVGSAVASLTPQA